MGKRPRPIKRRGFDLAGRMTLAEQYGQLTDEEYEQFVQRDMRYHALQTAIETLSRHPLSPLGRRLYDRLVADRDALRLEGLDTAHAFYLA